MAALARESSGFTLIELLLSVAIIGILTALSVPFYESFVHRNDLDVTTQTVAGALRRAQAYARQTKGDNPWSVELQSGSVTIFRGTNFAGRDTNHDETASIPGSITLGGLSEVQFAKLTGIPNTTGDITLTSTTNDVRTITINAKGMVEY